MGLTCERQSLTLSGRLCEKSDNNKSTMDAVVAISPDHRLNSQIISICLTVP